MGELGPHLSFMYFFNYGDPFMNPRAEDMLVLAKQINPAMEIVTSTNGIPLAKESRARTVVESGVDAMTFTIGGAGQEGTDRMGSWRWSAPLARLRLRPRAGRLHLTLAGPPRHHGERPAVVTVRTPWGEHEVAPRPSRWTRFPIVVPESDRGVSPVPVVISVAGSWRPSDDGSRDDRDLGVMVRWPPSHGGRRVIPTPRRRLRAALRG